MIQLKPWILDDYDTLERAKYASLARAQVEGCKGSQSFASDVLSLIQQKLRITEDYYPWQGAVKRADP